MKSENLYLNVINLKNEQSKPFRKNLSNNLLYTLISMYMQPNSLHQNNFNARTLWLQGELKPKTRQLKTNIF